VRCVDAVVALRLEQRRTSSSLTFFGNRHGKVYDQARIARGSATCASVVLQRPAYRAARGQDAAAAKDVSRAREKQLQVVVQLGHRATVERAHVVRPGGDWSGRWRSRGITRSHRLGVVHAVEETAARYGCEGLDVTPRLRVERVENERGTFPIRDGRSRRRARSWYLEREILEVVWAGAR